MIPEWWTAAVPEEQKPSGPEVEHVVDRTVAIAEHADAVLELLGRARDQGRRSWPARCNSW